MQHNLDNIIVMYFYLIFCLISAFPASAEEVTNLTKMTYLDGTRNGSSGVITSPNYPSNYSDNVNYTWILRTGHPKAVVKLTILDMDIRKFEGDPCEDYLKITEILPFWNLALKRCGQFSSFDYLVYGDMISISFVSDKDLNAKGFNLTWKVHLPEIITTLMTTTRLITTTITTLTTTLPTTLMTTTRTTLVTTPPTLKTTFMATTSQPSSAPITSPHVSSTLSNPTTKRTPKPKEETSSVLTTTKPVATTTTFIASTTQPLQTTYTITMNTTSTKGNVPLAPEQIMYLILGISLAELLLIAFGICIIKRRKKDSRSTKANNRSRDIQVDKVRPISRRSVISVANVYESIPLDHFSHEAILEEDEKEGMYVDLPEHVYDRQFAHRPHRNENVNFYQLISELKNKKA